MIIDSHREYFLCLFLADHILIQKFFNLFWLQEIDVSEWIPMPSIIIFKFLFYNLCADIDALVTDISPIGACNQFSHLVLRLITERASHLIVVLSYHTLTS